MWTISIELQFYVLLPPIYFFLRRFEKRALWGWGILFGGSIAFFALLNMLPMPGEFTPGPGPQVFQIDGVAFTPLICYELLFPNVVRASLRAGGEVLLNLTNDYWFGPYGEPRQHLALCRMCAFETGRPIVRATNTGMSAFIDASGQILEHAGVWKQAVLRGTLPIPPMHWTPFARWGSWTTAGAMAAALLLVWLTWKLVPANVAVPVANDSNGNDAGEVVA